MGNSVSRIPLQSFWGNATSTIPTNRAHSIMNSRKPDGGGMNPGGTGGQFANRKRK